MKYWWYGGGVCCSILLVCAAYICLQKHCPIDRPVLAVMQTNILPVKGVKLEAGLLEGDVLRVQQIISNNSNQPVELLKVQGDCSCFLKAEYPEVIGARKTEPVELLFDRKKFGKVESLDLGYAVAYKFSKQKEANVSKFSVNVSLSSDTILLLPPKHEICVQDVDENHLVVKKAVLVPPSFRVQDIVVEPKTASDQKLIANSEVEMCNQLLYEGKWRKVADIKVSLSKSEIYRIRKSVPITVRCFVRTNNETYHAESDIVLY